jgi:MFS family permease
LLDPAIKETAPLFVPRPPALASVTAVRVPRDRDDDNDDDDDDDRPRRHSSVDEATVALLGAGGGGGAGGNTGRGNREPTMGARLAAVLRDRDVLIVFGALLASAMNLAALEPTLPFYWLQNEFTSSPFLLGLAFSAAAAGYLLATPVVAWLGTSVSRYLVVMAGLLLMCLAMLAMALPLSLGIAAIPVALLGVGMAQTTVAAMPMLATLVDSRHAGEFDLIFLLGEMSTTLGQIVGALGGAFASRFLGLFWTTLAFAGWNVLYAPLLVLTRRTTRERFKIEPYPAPSPPSGDRRGTAGGGGGGGLDSAQAVTPARPASRAPLMGGRVNLAALMGLPPPGSSGTASSGTPPGLATPSSIQSGRYMQDDEEEDHGDERMELPRVGHGSSGGDNSNSNNNNSGLAAMVTYLLQSQAMQGPYSYSAATSAFHQQGAWVPRSCKQRDCGSG